MTGPGVFQLAKCPLDHMWSCISRNDRDQFVIFETLFIERLTSATIFQLYRCIFKTTDLRPQVPSPGVTLRSLFFCVWTSGSVRESTDSSACLVNEADSSEQNTMMTLTEIKLICRLKHRRFGCRSDSKRIMSVTGVHCPVYYALLLCSALLSLSLSACDRAVKLKRDRISPGELLANKFGLF